MNKDCTIPPAHRLTLETLDSLITMLDLQVTITGNLIWFIGAIVRGCPSGTAQGSLSARFFARELGTRMDEPTLRLMLALHNIPLGFQAFHVANGFRSPHYRSCAQRLQVPVEGEFPPQLDAAARMTFFDSVVERYLTAV